MEVDCSTVLHMSGMVSVDACAAARAAIRAAEIQAKATRHAGTLTLIAGCSAIVAGAFTYFAAISQNRELRKTQRARQSAYRSHIMNVLVRAQEDLHFLKVKYKQIRFNGGLDGSTLQVSNVAVARDQLAPGDWQNQALLGVLALMEVSIAAQSLSLCFAHARKIQNGPYSPGMVNDALAAVEEAMWRCNDLWVTISATIHADEAPAWHHIRQIVGRLLQWPVS